ncbi:MAG: sigma-70 family RNA polymerase sigma factor [Clostridia bacterium]|nr:sigma-70 family RNA polymerase sigma factor [Clostridia bacterium]
MDFETVNKAIRGNHKAFETIVTEMNEQVYRIAICYLHNEQDALDVISSSMLYAYKYIGKLKNQGYFSTWYIKIVINECKKVLDKRIHVIELESSPDADFYEDDPENIDLLDALNSIPEQDRLIIYLKYYQGYTLKEIGEILDLPHNSVKTRLYRRLDSLKLQLSYEEEISNE